MQHHTSSVPPAGGAPPQARAYQTAREQTKQRVQRYKRGLTVAAFLGFGMLGIVIGYPKLVPSISTTTSSQSTQSTQSNQSTFFNQQGGNVNGSSNSQQQPSTSSSAS